MAARERDYRDDPNWVPDPEWDHKMESENKIWCLKHDCWRVECVALHVLFSEEDGNDGSTC